eukprot:6905043-Prorocentrum_lima.AAC.1
MWCGRPGVLEARLGGWLGACSASQPPSQCSGRPFVGGRPSSLALPLGASPCLQRLGVSAKSHEEALRTKSACGRPSL